MTLDARIQSAPLALEALITATDRPDCGALAVFVGVVRDHNDGRGVTHLIYTAHEPLADKMIREIEDKTRAAYGVEVCRVVHRVGQLAVGEAAIIALARAPHRAEAFDAVRAVVEDVKHRVPIWKEEFFTDGTSAFVPGCSLLDGEPT